MLSSVIYRIELGRKKRSVHRDLLKPGAVVEEVAVVCAVGIPSGLGHLVEEVEGWPAVSGPMGSQLRRRWDAGGRGSANQEGREGQQVARVTTGARGQRPMEAMEDTFQHTRQGVGSTVGSIWWWWSGDGHMWRSCQLAGSP